MLEKCGKAIAAIQGALSCSSSGATMVRENRPKEVVSRRHRISPSKLSSYEQREVSRPQAPARHSSHENRKQNRKRKTRVVRPRSKDLLMSSMRSLDQSFRRVSSRVSSTILGLRTSWVSSRISGLKTGNTREWIGMYTMASTSRKPRLTTEVTHHHHFTYHSFLFFFVCFGLELSFRFLLHKGLCNLNLRKGSRHV